VNSPSAILFVRTAVSLSLVLLFLSFVFGGGILVVLVDIFDFEVN